MKYTGPLNYIKPYGLYLNCCGHWLLKQYRQLSNEAIQALNWWEKGQLDLLYRDRITVSLVDAIGATRRGFDYAENERIKDKSRKD